MMKTIDTPTRAKADSVISEVRRHKREIAEEHGFDVIAMGRALQERQNGDRRFVTLEGESGRREVLTPAPHTTGHTDPISSRTPESR